MVESRYAVGRNGQLNDDTQVIGKAWRVAKITVMKRPELYLQIFARGPEEPILRSLIEAQQKQGDMLPLRDLERRICPKCH